MSCRPTFGHWNPTNTGWLLRILARHFCMKWPLELEVQACASHVLKCLQCWKKTWMVWIVKHSEFFQQLRCWLRHEYVFTHFLVWHIDPFSHMNTVTHVLHAWSYMYYRYYAKICQAICDASVWTAGFIIVIFSSLPHGHCSWPDLRR